MIGKKIMVLKVFVFLVILGCNSNNEIVVREDLVNQKEQEGEGDKINNTGNSKPLFVNSIASTNIDFITSTDPDTFLSISFKGRFEKEMPGVDNLIDPNAFVFEAQFTGNKKIEIWCHSSFRTQELATEYANKLTDKLGKLPVFMRDELLHVVVHNGEGGAFAEDIGRFFVIFSERMDKRISENDLEETVFHEAAHVAFDPKYAASAAWKKNQNDDATFITEYAQSRAEREDIAETVLFVYTMMKYPGRLSSDVESWVKTNIPNRYNFLKEIISKLDVSN